MTNHKSMEGIYGYYGWMRGILICDNFHVGPHSDDLGGNPCAIL